MPLALPTTSLTLFRFAVVNNTSASPLVLTGLTDNGTTYTNEGATACTCIVLPACEGGLEYEFLNTVGYGFLVRAKDGNKIRNIGTWSSMAVSGTGGQAYSCVPGARMKLRCYNTSYWVVAYGDHHWELT